ncbi:MAG: tol-pal system-associated acyl-CoA thioesterase [Dongiaceae bacterium]
MAEALQPAGGDRLGAHRLGVRVYYEDTDAGGIVYHANYLRFAERARTEMMRHHGPSHAEMIATAGVAFAVRRCAVEYLRPARLDDWLEVESVVMGVGAATLDLRQTVRRGAETLTELDVRLVCIDTAGRPARLPPPVRAALTTLLQSRD